MTEPSNPIHVRNTTHDDIAAIIELTTAVYPDAQPWRTEQLQSHLKVFAEGQFVSVEEGSGKIVGMASSLIVLWNDYETDTNWRDFTDRGFFTNHDAEWGRTLYGAEVMVHPDYQGRGIGKLLYQARRELTQRLGLLRIRAGARLRGYADHAELSVQEYVDKVIRGELGDPTLSFQLKQGFKVLAAVKGYLRDDPDSQGHAAVIEWLNPEVATEADRPKNHQSDMAIR
ncbi:MAG: GNAT family N-acetyltransferase [Bryobacteraceae bacterium]